jgi:hypothetical protein
MAAPKSPPEKRMQSAPLNSIWKEGNEGKKNNPPSALLIGEDGGRSRTRIYDLHDVNVEECLYYQLFVKLFGKNSVNSVFI